MPEHHDLREQPKQHLPYNVHTDGPSCRKLTKIKTPRPVLDEAQ
jgi:hypothetical protein